MGNGLESGCGFNLTQWSLVLKARDGNFQQSQQALEQLCANYQSAIYSFIRYAERVSREEAEDLAQEFLSSFIEKNWLGHLKFEKKFRSFLLTFLKRFLSDARDRKLALKRGGGCKLIPLTAPDGADWNVAGSELQPDEAYDRKFAEQLFCEAARRLKLSYYDGGKGNLYEAIKDIVPGRHGDKCYARIGTELGKSEQAIKNAVIAYRREYRVLMEQEVARIVADHSEIQHELNYLIGLLGR
jgi:DNA-directed RNA polymerase specialized sigma24 family protein